MNLSKNDLLFGLALLLALWFCFTGIVWVYWAALFIAYPAGLISFFIWRHLNKEPANRNKIILFILITGFLLSMGVLLYHLIFG